MIDISIFGENFEQDVKPLIKEFYPNEDIRAVYYDGEEYNRRDNSIMCKSNRMLTKEGRIPSEEDGVCIILILLNNCFHILLNGIEQVKEDVAFKEVSQKQRHKEYRNQLLRALYRVLSRKTGNELPWGILTGVRPTKLVLEQLEEGCTNIASYMREQYYCSEEKTRLSYIVADRELKLLQEMDYKKGYSLYIGIPFCPSICNYCSFGSHPIDKNKQLVEPYIEALCKEIDYASTCFANRKLETVYIGGGTPTSLDAEQLVFIINKVKERFNFNNVLEFTVEAGRPDSINIEKLTILKSAGVTRISINPQSMVQRTLDLIGRRHTAKQIEEAFYMARECGFDNINMDIIIGLTGEGPEDVKYTLDRIEKLNPESLTVHTLALKRAARLTTRKEIYEGMAATGVLGMLKLTQEYAASHKYFPYYLYRQKNMTENLENVGYSKFGRESLYNILIMEEKQIILAVGAGASSKFVFEDENRFERVENVKSVSDYINRIDEMIERKRLFLTEKASWL